MSDIVERLREFAKCDDGVSPYNSDGLLVTEAADKIERLRVEVANRSHFEVSLRSERDRLRAEVATAWDTIEALKKESMLRGESNKELRAEVEALNTEILHCRDSASKAEDLEKEVEALRADADMWRSRAIALFWNGNADKVTVKELREATDAIAAAIDAARREP